MEITSFDIKLTVIAAGAGEGKTKELVRMFLEDKRVPAVLVIPEVDKAHYYIPVAKLGESRSTVLYSYGDLKETIKNLHPKALYLDDPDKFGVEDLVLFSGIEEVVFTKQTNRTL